MLAATCGTTVSKAGCTNAGTPMNRKSPVASSQYSPQSPDWRPGHHSGPLSDLYGYRTVFNTALALESLSVSETSSCCIASHCNETFEELEVRVRAEEEVVRGIALQKVCMCNLS